MKCNQPNARVPVDFEGHHLNIKIDALGKKVWVCIDEQSVFRAQHLTKVTIEDDRIMFQKESLQTILDRQAEEGNPLLTVLQGAMTRLEEATEHIAEVSDWFKEGKLSEHGDSGLDDIVDDNRAFIEELQVAGLCRELILKAQRPIETNVPDMEGQILIYNEDRSFETMITMDAQAMLMFGTEYKIYLKARLWIDGVLQLTARVEEQSW